MSYNRNYHRTKTDPNNAIWWSVGLFFFILIFGALVLCLSYSATYSNRIFPGIAVNGVDLSGQTLDQALITVQSSSTYPETGKIVLTDGENQWMVTPAQLGYTLDAVSSVEEAFLIGRDGWLLRRVMDQASARFSGKNISLRLINDQKVAQAFMVSIRAQIDRPVQEASIHISGIDVSVEPGQVGRSLDIPATMALVQNQLQRQQDAILPVGIAETQPSLLDLSSQAEHVKKILSAQLVVKIPAGEADHLGPWSINPQDLATMLVFTRIEKDGKTDVSIQINQALLGQYLQTLTPVVDQDALNARFIFNDDTRQLDILEKSQIGRQIDLEKSAYQISEKLLAGEHQSDLVVNITQPKVADTAAAADLGITELIHEEFSYFYGSDSARINNIHTAAARFHGLLVAPGETLSMSDVIGDVSLDSGFSEALIIYGSETIKGVGGGVCQVSTTLFRAAFFTGFPIIERHAHAYRVGYYEQTYTGDHDQNLAGLDATVFVPVVDMKFINDTPYWLLMETYSGDTYLQWKFYSTSDGRTVDWQTTGPTNIVDAPDPKYVKNDDLPEDKIKQIDYSADGADITVDRTVYKDDKVYFKDSVVTHYQPWQAVYEYGPGAKIPKKYRTDE